MVYSPGEGPVPFTYSAEAYPLYVREYGMGLATATTWFFNFVLSVTWPSLLAAFKPQGAFGWYAAWNIIGFFLVLFFVVETKGKTLEELDMVFSGTSSLLDSLITVRVLTCHSTHPQACRVWRTAALLLVQEIRLVPEGC